MEESISKEMQSVYSAASADGALHCTEIYL